MSEAGRSDLERDLHTAAYLVVRHGEAYVAVLDRLEHELAKIENRASNRSRAAAILAQMTREVRSVSEA